MIYKLFMSGFSGSGSGCVWKAGFLLPIMIRYFSRTWHLVLKALSRNLWLSEFGTSSSSHVAVSG